jgi:serine/threonine-protein kinase
MEVACRSMHWTRALVIAAMIVISIGAVDGANSDQVTTIAGTGISAYGGDGGPALEAHLFSPSAVAVAADGSVFFSDVGNYRIRRITPGGLIETVAGNGTYGDINYGDIGDGGPATSASLSDVVAIALDAPRNALHLPMFADRGRRRVRAMAVRVQLQCLAGVCKTACLSFGWPAQSS